MTSCPLDLDEVVDILGAVTGRMARDPRFATVPGVAIVRRIDALRADIVAAAGPTPRRAAPAPRSVEQWA